MKKFALNSAARVFVIVFQLINIKLYTNYLTANELGVFFFLLAVSYSANAILFVPLDYFQQAKLLNFMTEFGGLRSLFVSNCKVVKSYLAVMFLIILVTSHFYYAYVSHVGLVMLLALALYIVQALRNTLNNLNHGNHVSISFIQEAFVKVGLLYVLVDWMKPDASLLIISWLVSLALTTIYLFIIANKHRIFSGDDEHCVSGKEVFSFAYPFSVGAVANWLQLQGYRLVLVPLGYAEIVGIFATLSGIGSAAIGAVSLIYGQQFTPKIYQTYGKFTKTYLKGAFAAMVVVALFLYVLGDFLVGLLTNRSFITHSKLILFGVLTDSANLFVGALAIHISITGSTKKIIASSILGLVSMLVFFLLIYMGDAVTENTVGVPLLISQWCVVGYMYWKFVKLPVTAKDSKN